MRLPASFFKRAIKLSSSFPSLKERESTRSILMPHKNFQARVEKRSLVRRNKSAPKNVRWTVRREQEREKRKQGKKQREYFPFHFTVKSWSRRQLIRWDTVTFTRDIRDVGWQGVECSVSWNEERHYFCNKSGRYSYRIHTTGNWNLFQSTASRS